MKISLEIPDQFSLLGDAKVWEQELKLNTALLLYSQGRFTIGQATRFSGLGKLSFMQACSKQEIPVLVSMPWSRNTHFICFTLGGNTG